MRHVAEEKEMDDRNPRNSAGSNDSAAGTDRRAFLGRTAGIAGAAALLAAFPPSGRGLR